MADVNWDAVGMAADALDNALAALKIPMRPQTHLEGITAVVERTRGELRRAYVEATGENPWEGDP